MGCHDNRFDVLVVPALNVFVLIAGGDSIFVRESANTKVFFLVQASLGVPEPKVEAEDHHDTDKGDVPDGVESADFFQVEEDSVLVSLLSNSSL